MNLTSSEKLLWNNSSVFYMFEFYVFAIWKLQLWNYDLEVWYLVGDIHILQIQPSHYAFSGPFEMATGIVDFQRALELEDLLRQHPIAKDLNRAWMVVAQKK